MHPWRLIPTRPSFPSSLQHLTGAGHFISLLHRMRLSMLALVQRQCSADQAHMGESLREIAKCIAGPWVRFFAEQPKVIGRLQGFLKAFVALLKSAPADRQILRSPESAYSERALCR